MSRGLPLIRLPQAADGAAEPPSICSIPVGRHEFVPHGDAYYQRVLRALAGL